MRLHQATRYAIWVTVYMASRPKEQLSASYLADVFGISQHHLAKVLRSLSVAKLVSSTRGPGGGCTFIADPKRVTLYDIIVLFEDNWWSEEDQAPSDNDALATLYEVSRVLSEIDRITMATLRSVTVQTIINNAERRQGLRDTAREIAESVSRHMA